MDSSKPIVSNTSYITELMDKCEAIIKDLWKEHPRLQQLAQANKSIAVAESDIILASANDSSVTETIELPPPIIGPLRGYSLRCIMRESQAQIRSNIPARNSHVAPRTQGTKLIVTYSAIQYIS